MDQKRKIDIIEELRKDHPAFAVLLGYDKIIERITEGDVITELIQNLSWSLPDDVQKNAMEKVKNFITASDADMLVLPLWKIGKSTWHNAVNVVEALGYPKNKKAMPSLIFLLQDTNWPGASQGMSILSKIDRSELIALLEVAIKDAYKGNDFDWLAGIKLLLESYEIPKSDFVNHDMFDLLKFASW